MLGWIEPARAGAPTPFRLAVSEWRGGLIALLAALVSGRLALLCARDLMAVIQRRLVKWLGLMDDDLFWG